MRRYLPYLPTIVLTFLASAALGALYMNRISFWFDEVASMEFATGDLAAGLQRFPDQMPTYFLVLRGWIALAGYSEVAGRWLSLLFGLLTLALTFRLAR